MLIEWPDVMPRASLPVRRAERRRPHAIYGIERDGSRMPPPTLARRTARDFTPRRTARHYFTFQRDISLDICMYVYNMHHLIEDCLYYFPPL